MEIARARETGWYHCWRMVTTDINEHIAARQLLTLLLEVAGSFIRHGSSRFVTQYCENPALARLISFWRSYLNSIWECFVNIVNVVICKRACGCQTTRLLLVYRELSHPSPQKPSGQSRLLSSLSCFAPSRPSQLHQPWSCKNINETIIGISPDNLNMPHPPYTPCGIVSLCWLSKCWGDANSVHLGRDQSSIPWFLLLHRNPQLL